ncbi:adenylate/guanylate cyclase domain-containing protein [Nocardioides sp. C4-1]|uniref:adenylate/guanylate cyclase domain-containing protein n=1 Tax=Nocardioides sp. C4-1 TaxID=3151851 RepID=UPI003263E043
MPLDDAVRLWSLLGFAHVGDDEVVFTQADVDALRGAQELVELGVLSPERQAALVRTWGRSYARLADWQTSLLATVAVESGADPDETVAALATEVIPRVEALQSYVWRRHLVSAGARRLATTDPTDLAAAPLTVGFVDIVGYTSRSKELTEDELVAWIEGFEDRTSELVAAHGGRIIKNIGDEVLFVADGAGSALDVALELCRRGDDPDDGFPQVRAGLAHGDVVRRLGDVYGETVNIAARLTSVARPGTVLVDRGAFEALTGRDGHDAADTHDAHPDLVFRRLRRLSVKGYARLAAWAVRVRER